MKVCEITGKVALVGNNVSHSNVKTKRKFSPNLKTKRFWSEEEGRWITLKVSTSGIKTINKKGLAAALKDAAAPKKIYYTFNKLWQRKVTEFRSSWSAPSRRRVAYQECRATSPLRTRRTPLTVWSVRSTIHT